MGFKPKSPLYLRTRGIWHYLADNAAMQWNFVKAPLQLLVGGAIAAHLALMALQNLGLAPPWLAELSRFLPFYWLLLPLGGSVVLALFLRPLWVVAAVVNLALFVLSTMDFHWQLWPKHEVAGTHVRVLSYNIKALSARHRAGGISDIELEVQEYAPDIVALQDAQHWLTESDDTVPTVARPVFGLPHVIAFDQYVLASRYPLQDCKTGSLGPGDKLGHYLQCTARIGAQEVQLVTAHFVSPRSSLLATKRKFADGLQDWQTNLARRMTQSQALLSVVSQLPRPLLVMGDFNAPEQSPVVQSLKRAGLADAFAEGGTGWGYTHGHALSQHIDLYRIDHILRSAGVAVQSAFVGRSDASEHNPVIADLLILP